MSTSSILFIISIVCLLLDWCITFSAKVGWMTKDGDRKYLLIDFNKWFKLIGWVTVTLAWFLLAKGKGWL